MAAEPPGEKKGSAKTGPPFFFFGKRLGAGRVEVAEKVDFFTFFELFWFKRVKRLPGAFSPFFGGRRSPGEDQRSRTSCGRLKVPTEGSEEPKKWIFHFLVKKREKRS